MSGDASQMEGRGEPPTIAVALRYEEGEGSAPIVVASGKGSLAERILAAAHDAGVAIEENPMLASALEKAPLDEPIPQELYQAVAEVIGWVLHARGTPTAPVTAPIPGSRGAK